MRVFAMIAGAVLFLVAALRRKNENSGGPVVKGPLTDAELESVHAAAAAAHRDAPNWRVSIVDYLKILGQPSSLSARKELAAEYKYAGNASPGSAEWNQWLHAETMKRLRDGRLVPGDAGDD